MLQGVGIPHFLCSPVVTLPVFLCGDISHLIPLVRLDCALLNLFCSCKRGVVLVVRADSILWIHLYQLNSVVEWCCGYGWWWFSTFGGSGEVSLDLLASLTQPRYFSQQIVSTRQFAASLCSRWSSLPPNFTKRIS